MTDTGRNVDEGQAPQPGSRHKLVKLTLDPASIKRGNANIEHEREVAIYDILEANEFELIGQETRPDAGPYALLLGVVEDRLVFTVTPDAGTPDAGGTPTVVQVPLMPLRRVMKDYFLVCETYFDAIRSAPPSKIQQIDVGRRALHDEGATALTERIRDRIRLDVTTARRLFTLVCALHWRG
jgi:uncharacterized protein (UPF0262 family)